MLSKESLEGELQTTLQARRSAASVGGRAAPAPPDAERKDASARGLREKHSFIVFRSIREALALHFLRSDLPHPKRVP
jgi:hypothetical protein